jgi:hypothetical protein
MTWSRVDEGKQDSTNDCPTPQWQSQTFQSGAWGLAAVAKSVVNGTEREVCVALTGDTGTGKSSFGNAYLGNCVFEESDSPDPVTLETTAQSAMINGLRRWVIDTQGLADGQNISAEQIQNMALFLKDWRRGVNGIAIVLNGQHDRFSQGIQDVIRFVYNAFGTPDILSHMCIIFTHCYEVMPNRPNRERKRTEYAQRVQAFLSRVSGRQDVPQIPVFFVDSCDLASPETIENLIQFHGWLTSKDPLDTRSFQAVNLHNRLEDETETGVFVGYDIEGDQRFERYIDCTRQQIIPYNGDEVRYSAWRTTRAYRIPAGQPTHKTLSRNRVQEVRKVEHHPDHSFFGFSSRDHTHWSIWRREWTEESDVIIDFDGKQIVTPWRQVGGVREWEVCKGRDHGYTSGWVNDIQ